MIKQLLNSVITKYHDLPVSRRSIICLGLRLQQIIYLLATDKSRYFAQPRPIIVNYFRLSSLLCINFACIKDNATVPLFAETFNKEVSNVLCEKPIIFVELLFELRNVVIQDG